MIERVSFTWPEAIDEILKRRREESTKREEVEKEGKEEENVCVCVWGGGGNLERRGFPRNEIPPFLRYGIIFSWRMHRTIYLFLPLFKSTCLI